MICRLCSLEAPENPKAKPNAWNFGVCQACTKTTRLRHLSRIQYQRNTGREDETVTATCSYCAETKTVRAFAPSALASGMVGFPQICGMCHYQIRHKPKSDDFSDLV